MNRGPGTLAVIAALLIATGAHAAVADGVRFKDRVETPGIPLELHRAATMHYRLFFDVYVAALYLSPGLDPKDLLTKDAGRRLEIHYLYGFSAEDFQRSTLEGIERNVSPAALERIRPSIEAFNALYRSVVPGDRYAVTYLPGVGPELRKNDERKALIACSNCPAVR